MQTFYGVGQACLNGHRVNGDVESNPGQNMACCPQCGAATIIACPACRQPIHGNQFFVDEVDKVFGGTSSAGWHCLESYCYHCGTPYPWTERKAKALEDMIAELVGLEAQEREKLKESIPDILVETPKSDVAVLRYKNAFSKVSIAGAKLLRDLVVSVAGSAIAKKFAG